MSGEIDTLIQLIAKHNRFDENKYPKLKGASDKERLLFAINHSALHFSKVAGKVAAASERVDYGEELNTEEIKTNVSKALINTLRLAELVGMTEKDLMEAIEKQYGEKIE